MASYRSAVGFEVHADEVVKYTRFEDGAQLQAFLRTWRPRRRKAPVVTQDKAYDRMHDWFLDEHGSVMYAAFENILEEFGAHGIMDRASYSGFLDVITSSLHRKIKEHGANDSDEDLPDFQ